jgi:hypothetical protein
MTTVGIFSRNFSPANRAKNLIPDNQIVAAGLAVAAAFGILVATAGAGAKTKSILVFPDSLCALPLFLIHRSSSFLHA